MKILSDTQHDYEKTWEDFKLWLAVGFFTSVLAVILFLLWGK